MGQSRLPSSVIVAMASKSIVYGIIFGMDFETLGRDLIVKIAKSYVRLIQIGCRHAQHSMPMESLNGIMILVRTSFSCIER